MGGRSRAPIAGAHRGEPDARCGPLYNPTYAARPDNTGLALMRYAGHRDVDLIGSRLSIPIDINTFTDREVYLLGSLSFSLFDSTERDAREGAGD